MLDTCRRISIALLIVMLAVTITYQSALEENGANSMSGDALGSRKRPEPRNKFEAEFMRRLASSPGQNLGRLTERQIEQLQKGYMNDGWEQYTPAPVTEPNCHVEIQVTQRVPGRCTKLGGRIPACQGQDFITIDYHECS